MRIDGYEGRIKRLVLQKDKGTLSMNQVLYSFESSLYWQDIQSTNKPLHKLFKHKLLMDEKKPPLLSMDRLLLLGLVLCRGEKMLKARVFYDILQGIADHISAADKDFKITIKRLVEVSVYLVTQFYIEQGGKTTFLTKLPRLGTPEFNSKLEDLLDLYQNTVYVELESRISRQNLILRTVKYADYILDAEKMRAKWFEIC